MEVQLKRVEVDEVLDALYVIPIVPRNTILKKHSVVIKEGKIEDILPTKEAHEKYKARIHHEDLSESHILMPGLINMHTHTPMTLLRGFADDVNLQTWLQEYIWPAEGEFVAPEFVEDGSALAISEMIRCGVTCFNDMYFYPGVTARIAEDVGMRCAVGIPVLQFPSKYAGLEKGKSIEQQYIDVGMAQVYDKFKDSKLVQITIAPHAAYTVGDEGYEKVIALSNKLNLKIHTHIHETKIDIENHRKAYKDQTCIQRIEALGLFKSKGRVIAAHCVHLDDKDRALFKEGEVSVVHCPESNLKLSSGVCDIASLLKIGVNVCLGTDGAASNDDLDLFGELRTAALLSKLVANSATAVPAWQILEVATINGAKALGIDKRVGSLEKGKEADIVAIKLKTEPVYNPITNLVYVGTNRVTDVWIQGKQVLMKEQLITMNEHNVLRRAALWGEKISTWKKQLDEQKQTQSNKEAEQK